MLKKLLLFFLLNAIYGELSAQERANHFQREYISSIQFVELEQEPYKTTSFSVDAQSAVFLDKYDLSKFTMVREVSCKFFSSDSLLQTVLRKLSALPALEAIEITEYPIFPPLDRSGFGKKKFPAEIGLFKKLKAIKFSLLKNYDWEDIFSTLSRVPTLEELNISLSYFKEIPIALRKLSNIRSLTIYDNEWIESLPEWITEFTKLDHINISQNPKLNYTEAFTLLGKLPKLHTLELSYCRFTDIPITITSMQSLRKIAATGLSIKNIDGFFTTLSELPELKELWIRVGDSTILPASIGRLRKLQRLSLDSRKITRLPEEIGKLTELKVLSLEGNHLKELPQSFYSLKKLESVNLGFNQIESISNDIQGLKNIESLQLTKNNLKEIPPFIGELQKCKKLLLSNNQLRNLPKSISSMGALEELSVSNNQLSGLLNDFAGLKKLSRLDASQNLITSLDPSIGELTNLTTLLLNNNLLEILPASICSLNKLKNLDAYSNKLRELPTDMGNLENLETLNLGSGKPANSFRYLPSSLGRLKKLKTVNLFNNQSLDGDSAIRIVYRMQSPAERFNLSGCNISSLPENGWIDCRIQYLDIGNNNIKTVPAGLLDAPKLRYLRLSANPVPPAFTQPGILRNSLWLLQQKMDYSKIFQSYHIRLLCVKHYTKLRIHIFYTGGMTKLFSYIILLTAYSMKGLSRL